jgi:ABC-2 type transport system permease protein
MKMWLIAWKDIRHYLSDKKTLLLMLLMPVILTAILGSALKGIMNGEAQSFPETTVALSNEDTGPLGKMLVDDVLQSQSFKEKIHIKKAASHQEAKNWVKEKEADVAVLIPAGYSQKVEEGKTGQISIVTDETKSTRGMIVESIVISFATRADAVSRTMHMVLTDLGTTQPMEMQTIAPEVMKDIERIASNPPTEVTGGAVGKKAVTAMQYYAAAMLAMFLLFNMIQGAKSILHEQSQDTLPRLLSTPTSKLSIILGKFLGVLAFSLTQLILFIFATHFMFGVDWGNQPLQVAALGIVYGFTVSGMAIFLASLSRREQEVDTIGSMGIQVLAILGGSMVPLAIFPDAMLYISKLTPNYWALNPLLEIMAGAEWQALFLPILILFAFGAIFLVLGTWRLRAR